MKSKVINTATHEEMINPFACPHCGSIAQPKLNTPPSVYYMGLVITTHKCGCGCVFERRYRLAEVKTVTKGNE